MEKGSAYLGRPWKVCSRMVFINTYLPGVSEWVGGWVSE